MFLREALRPIRRAGSQPRCHAETSTSAPPPTLLALLTGDLAHLIVMEFNTLDELGALLCSIKPVPAMLHDATMQRAVELLARLPLRSPWQLRAPLSGGGSGSSSSSSSSAGGSSSKQTFEEAALWALSVPASRWHPAGWIARLRAPPFCRVAGSGVRCSHGLCQKQEAAAPGVMPLLRALASARGGGRRSRADAPPGPEPQAPPLAALALEVRAWLLGALGRNDDALAEWAAAAHAGSARAQLDLGLRMYRKSEEGGAEMLRLALENERLPPRERSLVRAKAHLYLGLMHLDGDAGVEQSDAVAASHFKLAAAAGASLKGFALKGRAGATGVGEAELSEEWWNRWYYKELTGVMIEASKALGSMERFTFYANGRP